MAYPSSIDLMHSVTELDVEGGWMEIHFEHTFTPKHRIDGAHDQQQGRHSIQLIGGEADGRARMLSPTAVRHFSAQAARPMLKA